MQKVHNYYFDGKEPGEQVEMLVRHHKVALGAKLFVFFLGLFGPVLVYALLSTYTTVFDDTSGFSFLLLVLLGSVFYLYMLLFIYHAWVDFYLDIWVVTNKRIIATEQRGLFNRITSELSLDRIQDVSSEVRGFLGTIFRYGTIQIQTASEEDKFEFIEVPKPDVVSRQILELHQQYQPPQPTQRPGEHQDATHYTPPANAA